MNNNLPLEILDSLSEGVITLDKELKVTFINHAAETITGLKKSEMVGKLCNKVFQPDSCKMSCPICMVLETGEGLFNYKTKFVTKSNGEIPIKLNTNILYDNNHFPIGAALSFVEQSNKNNWQNKTNKTTDFYGIVGSSKPMKEIYKLIDEISDSDAPVLIQGETGTGKEMIANAIQATSKRKRNPFLKINCAVFPQDLLASELFGHVKGAFTGAERDRIGRFKHADSGTMFLDEISEMPIQMQAHLLRILQNGNFERIGDSQTRHTDVRIIAATNINAELAVKNNDFREDLFYRINVVPINLPPLRKRKEDIPRLVNHFIKKFANIYQKPIEGIEKQALDMLLDYNWPGNVRQLENAVEYSFVRSHQNINICKQCLPSYLHEVLEYKNENYTVHHHEHISKEKLNALLDENGWNRSKVADLLGVNRTTVWRKMKNLNLTKQ